MHAKSIEKNKRDQIKCKDIIFMACDSLQLDVQKCVPKGHLVMCAIQRDSDLLSRSYSVEPAVLEQDKKAADSHAQHISNTKYQCILPIPVLDHTFRHFQFSRKFSRFRKGNGKINRTFTFDVRFNEE